MRVALHDGNKRMFAQVGDRGKIIPTVCNVKSWAAQYENKLYLSHCTFWIWCYAVVCTICWRKQLREIILYHVNSGSPITPHIVFIKVLLQHDDSNIWNTELLKSFLVCHGNIGRLSEPFSSFQRPALVAEGQHIMPYLVTLNGWAFSVDKHHVMSWRIIEAVSYRGNFHWHQTPYIQ